MFEVLIIEHWNCIKLYVHYMYTTCIHCSMPHFHSARICNLNLDYDLAQDNICARRFEKVHRLDNHLLREGRGLSKILITVRSFHS